jgi:hypothetical protein
VWRQISAYQAMWLLPGLYLLEMVWLPLIGISLTMLHTRNVVLGMWAITGAILGFAILGAMSIGLAYIPVFILMGLSTILSPDQGLRDYLFGFIVAILAGAAQAGYMLAAIRVL